MANLTLSIDDDLLKKCRLYAVQHDTSVNAMVREYLETYVARSDVAEREERMKTVAEINRLSDELAQKAVVPPDYKWNRDELYEERMARWDSK